MRARVKNLLRSRRGDVTTGLAFGAFLIILVALFGMEYAAALEKYDYALDLIQRAVNTSVEYNIRDNYRSDRILKLDTAAARSTVRRYIDSDLNARGRYTVRIKKITAKATPPRLTVEGTGSFPTLLSKFGAKDVTFRFTVTSVNYDLDA